MYRASWDRSTISAEGAQRISAATVPSSTRRSLHGRPLEGLRSPAPGCPVDQPAECDDEVRGVGERGGVDALREVVVRVVPGGQVAVPIRRAEGDGTHPADARGE